MSCCPYSRHPLPVEDDTGAHCPEHAVTTLKVLKVPTGSALAEYSCLSLGQGPPHGPVHIYILRDRTPAGVLDEDSEQRGAVMRFSVLGQSPATARETVCARSPTPDEASALRIGSTTAVLAITRIATDSTDRAIEAGLPPFPGEGIDAAFTAHHVLDERQTQG
ncbi:UTRA domain-containing protein [Streptomyces sp. NPDC048680]|uniref:UTRA domain-containing protein n=1 Tax=Streptomyces sp. NPDC048680 TaxID=3155492 RepID=UPI00343F51BD